MFMSKLGGGNSQQPGFQIEPLEQRRLLSGAINSFTTDINLDGTVNALDFNSLAANYGQTATAWASGDFNYDGNVNAADFNLLASNYGSLSDPDVLGTLIGQPITTLSTKLLKLEGQFSGHYTSTTTGTHALTFDITSCTHTGHFTGTAEFTNSEGKFPATITGVIRSNRHVDLSYTGTGFSGSMTGIASHTAGSFSGDYANSTGPVSHGTYHVAKA